MTRKIIEDTFTDTDGTLLSAHTGETGADWSTPVFTPTPAGAKLEIQNNALAIGGTFSANNRSVLVTPLMPGNYGHGPYLFRLDFRIPVAITAGHTYTVKLQNAGGGNIWMKVDIALVDSLQNVKITLADGTTGNVNVSVATTFTLRAFHRARSIHNSALSTLEVSVDNVLIAITHSSEFVFSPSALTHSMTIEENSASEAAPALVEIERLDVTGGSVFMQDTFIESSGTNFSDHDGDLNASWSNNTVNTAKPNNSAVRIFDNEATPSGPDQVNNRDLFIDMDITTPPTPVEYVFVVRSDAPLTGSNNILMGMYQAGARVAGVSISTFNGVLNRFAGLIQTIISGIQNNPPEQVTEVVVRFTTNTDAEIFIDGASKATTTVASYAPYLSLEFRFDEITIPGGSSPPPAGVLLSTVIRVPPATPPMLLSISPADGSVIESSLVIVLTFDKNVSEGIGNIVLENTSGGMDRIISIFDPARVSFSGATVTITLLAPLFAATTYLMHVEADVIVDTNGEPFEGIAGHVLVMPAWTNYVGTKEL